MKKQVFHLPQDSISDIIGCVNEKNEQILTKEEILRKEQLLEETYLRLAKGMNNPALSATVTVTKRFGDVNLEISARGEAANPLISLSEWIEDESDLFSANLLKSNRHLLGYSRRNGENIVSIKIREGSGQQMVRMIVAMILGVGFIMMSSVFAAVGLPVGAVTFPCAWTRLWICSVLWLMWLATSVPHCCWQEKRECWTRACTEESEKTF